MKTFIALFRGINVGGRNSLPMKELVSLLEDLGCRSVKTYIRVAMQCSRARKRIASRLSNMIRVEIKKCRGFEPYVLLVGLEEMEKAIAGNPFPETESEPKFLHIGFLASAPATLI